MHLSGDVLQILEPIDFWTAQGVCFVLIFLTGRFGGDAEGPPPRKFWSGSLFSSPNFPIYRRRGWGKCYERHNSLAESSLWLRVRRRKVHACAIATISTELERAWSQQEVHSEGEARSGGQGAIFKRLGSSSVVCVLNLFLRRQAVGRVVFFLCAQSPFTTLCGPLPCCGPVESCLLWEQEPWWLNSEGLNVLVSCEEKRRNRLKVAQNECILRKVVIPVLR